MHKPSLVALTVAILVAACGPDPEELSRAGKLYSQGQEFYAKKDFASAEPLLKAALDKYIEIHGPDDRWLTGLRDNSDPSASVMYPSSLYAELARTYEKQGKFAQAEPLRRKDLQLHEKYLGQWGDGGDFSENGINEEIVALADNLLKQGKLDEAEKLYRHSIDVRVHNCSDNLKQEAEGKLSAKEYGGLAELNAQRGNTKEAEEYFKLAIDGMSSFGVNSIGDERLHETRMNFAKFLKNTGRESEAEDIEERQETEQKAIEEMEGERGR